MNQHVLIWTPEHNTALASLIGEGFSMAQSARSLNELFGTTYTRNAIIGKAHRLGLSKPKKIKKKKYAAKQEPRHRPGRYKPVGAPVFTPIADTMECSEVVPLNLSSPEPTGCQYAYGDGPFLFCGRPRDGKSSYCPAHHQLTAGRMIQLSPADHQRRRHRWMRLQSSLYSEQTLREHDA